MSTSTVFVRAGLVALGLGLVGAALTGCGAVSGTSTAGSAPTAAQTGIVSTPDQLTLPSIPATTAPATTPPTAPAPTAPAVPAVAVKTPVAPAPTPSICPAKDFRFVHISAVGVDPATGRKDFTAENAEIECGPGVPDDQQFVTIGQPVVYDVSPGGVTIYLAGQDGSAVSSTWAQFTASNIGEYGGYYGFNVGPTGLVTEIDQSWHP